jgi:hypothetical protein
MFMGRIAIHAFVKRRRTAKKIAAVPLLAETKVL